MKYSRLLSLTAATTLIPVITCISTPNALADMCSAQSTATVNGGNSNTGSAGVLSNLAGSSFAGSSRNGAANTASTTPATGVAKQIITSPDSPTHSLQFITGPSSPDRTDKSWGITSTDLGISYADNEGHTYLAFGDTGSCPNSSDTGWRSNVLTRTTDHNYGDGLNLQEALTSRGWSTDGEAEEFIRSLKSPNDAYGEVTTIPTAGIVINGVHYIDYMSVKHWGDGGRWDTNYAATVRSTDGGNTWNLVDDSIRPNRNYSLNADFFLPGGSYDYGNENLQMSGLIQGNDGYVYRLSTPSGRGGYAYLSRVRTQDFPNESAFQYWDGHGWSSNREVLTESDAQVFGPKVSELSITYNSYLGKYVVMYFNEDRGLVVRTADAMTGPWSNERLLIDNTNPEISPKGIYGGFVLPKQDDQNLYYVMSAWDDYNVYFMRTDLDFAMKNNIDSDNITITQVIQ